MDTENANNQEDYEPGGHCPECKKGVLGFGDVENCSCHISPPCWRCTENPLRCEKCGWVDEGGK